MTELTNLAGFKVFVEEPGSVSEDDESGFPDFLYQNVEGLSARSLGIQVCEPRYEYEEYGTSIVGSVASPATILWALKGSFWSRDQVSRHAQDSLFQDLIVDYLEPAIRSSLVGSFGRSAAVVSATEGARIVPARSSSPAPPRRQAAKKSPWADAIGPLYSVEAAAIETNMTVSGVLDAIDARALLAIQSDEGDLLLPVVQFDIDGKPVAGIRWILSRLDADLADSYMVAAWMNKARIELEGKSPWAVLKLGEGASPALKELVENMRTRFAQ